MEGEDNTQQVWEPLTDNPWRTEMVNPPCPNYNPGPGPTRVECGPYCPKG